MVISIYVAILAFLFIALSINVIKSRRLVGTAIGQGENLDLLRKIRAHANFSEYTPIFLIILAISELNGLHHYLLHFFGILFLIGRFLHAYGVLYAEKYKGGKLQGGVRFRVRGMVCTFTSIGFLSLILLIQFIISSFFAT